MILLFKILLGLSHQILHNNYVSNYYCFDMQEMNKFVKITMFQKIIVF